MAFFKSGLLRFVRYLTFLATLLIFVDVIYRMCSFGTTTDPYFFILTFYLIGFAFLLAVAEIRFKKVIVYIEFMRGRLGKGVFIVLVGLLIFEVEKVVELVFSCLIILIGIINIVVSFMRETLKEDEERKDLKDEERKDLKDDEVKRSKYFHSSAEEKHFEGGASTERTHLVKYTTTEKRYQSEERTLQDKR